jgi:hypothetical protein
MGLSDGERIHGMYFAISRLFKIKEQMEEEASRDRWYSPYNVPGVKDFAKIIDGLWHDLLGKNSNGMHWVVGSSSSNVITYYDARDPWSVAVSNFLFHCSSKRIEDLPKRKNKFDNDPFEHSLSIAGLLNNSFFANVFRIYQETEHVIYYLRRYDDEFLKGFEAIDKSTSSLQGLCFTQRRMCCIIVCRLSTTTVMGS